jgi:hypothetical protein
MTTTTRELLGYLVLWIAISTVVMVALAYFTAR